MLRLFTYCTSPFWKSRFKLNRSARKWSASRASAWASVMGGILELRGRCRNPVKLRRAYWITTRSGFCVPDGVWKSKGRVVYGFSGLPNLRISTGNVWFSNRWKIHTHQIPSPLTMSWSNLVVFSQAHYTLSSYWRAYFRHLWLQCWDRKVKQYLRRRCGRLACQ